MKKFFGEFKKFITRGNVIDMAVGVIVGGAFTAIVTALTNQVFRPLVNYLLAFGGENGLQSAVTILKPAFDEAGELVLANSIYIDWGAFITAILNFFITAFVLFVIVKAINGLKEVSKPKFYGYDKKEYRKMRREGMSEDEIEKAAAERDAKAAEEKAKADAEAKLHTTEGLLEQIKVLLEKQAEK